MAVARACNFSRSNRRIKIVFGIRDMRKRHENACRPGTYKTRLRRFMISQGQPALEKPFLAYPLADDRAGA